MINHVRTLFINETSTQSDVVGYAHIPADYAKKPASDLLRLVRSLIFGNNPDDAMRHWRACEFLNCAHASELSDLMFAKDSRITYPVVDSSIFDLRRYAAAIDTITSGADQELTILGDRDVSESDALLKRWTVSVVSSSEVEIRENSGLVETATYTVEDGLSSEIYFPSSSLRFRFAAGVGALWRVTSIARPSVGVVDVIRNVSSYLSDTDLSRLFSLSPEAWTVWSTSDRALSLAASLLLAVADATDGEL